MNRREDSRDPAPAAVQAPHTDASPGRALLAVRGLALSAGGAGRHDADRTLVRGLDWSVRAGECWCIIGRNGAGKSTLLRALAGVGTPQAGDILLQDKPLRDWPLPALARERAFLAQSRNDAFSYRVIDTVLMARHPYHANSYWEDTDDHRIAHDALRQMDVLDLAQRDVRTLSGGERQRVAIAALLAQDTPLMLLDEPATALDLAHQVAVMRLLSRLAREQGKCVIMVGHDLNLAASAATHALLLMGDGSWRAGSADEVLVPALLTECLGHPIGTVQYGAETRLGDPRDDGGRPGDTRGDDRRGTDRRGDDRRRIFINLET
ncbi:ABC transporter ATP-binding protein [Massilia arenosa]|uniref:ABC transporter ATP-binding protein n=1 Tax=Zemynaea arenosa TaxID=2561931 RepID=A0A4Y9S320_9BURK|nr:ABC transporter ATP-binding protein [Massilia arenosa]TFW14871.1 ABC transporter ATP-binding protein [Massilia arenosa]